MKSTLILNEKNYFLHSYMPSRKNATNLSEPLYSLVPILQNGLLPIHRVSCKSFWHPVLSIEIAKEKGGILVYSSESSRFGGKKIKLHATLPFGNAFSKLFVLCPSSHQSLTYAVSDLIDRLWQPKYLGTKLCTRRLQIRFDQSPSIKFKIYNSYDFKGFVCIFLVAQNNYYICI